MVYLGVTHLTGPPSAMIPDVDARPACQTSVRAETDGSPSRALWSGAAVGVAFTMVAWLAAGFDASMLWASLVFVPAGVAAAIDDLTGTLPDRWVLASAVGALVWSVVSVGPAGLLGCSFAALSVAVPVGVVHSVTPAAMGFGDVKYAAALGAALGVVTTTSSDRLLVAMLLLAVASGAALAYGVVRRRRSVPFGPCLLLGGGIATALAVQGAITT